MTNAARPGRPKRAERLDRILELLNEEGAVDVTTVADKLDVSAASIRRDLGFLEQEGLLRRTHGGAVAQGVNYELPLRYRSGQQELEKRCIAAVAATRVPETRTTVGLTGGTTTTEVARSLLNHRNLTVVTNALNIASELVVRKNVRVVVTGGIARAESYELVGPLAERTISGLNVDLAFLGFNGCTSSTGFTTHQVMEAHTNKALLSRAGTVVAVGDSSKLGKATFAQICELNEVDELITDDKADAEIVARLEDAGVRVTLVDPLSSLVR